MRAGLVAVTLALGSPVAAGELAHIGTYEWPTESVVGLSGIEVAADGTSFAAVGDRGWWIEGRFQREDDRIIGLEIERFLPILGVDGMPVAARRVGDWSDAEGLAIAQDGTNWVSFERYARAWSYASPTSVAKWTQDHPDFRTWADNRQLEALAVDADGAFYTFPENPGPEGFPVYRHDGGGWNIVGHLPDSDRFSIVGADFDDTGALWILERKLAFFWWWQNRIRRVDISNLSAEIMWTGTRGQFHNLEGIAVWRDDTGLRLTLVSDDNASAREETQFVEFRLTE